MYISQTSLPHYEISGTPYLYMSAYKSAEVVINTTKLARDEKYRAWACDQLTSATGLPITLDDAAEVQQYRPFDSTLIDWQKIRENLDVAVLKLDQLFDREELLRYGTELVNETLAEIEISRKISDQRASCNNDAAEQA
jgi:hypothetical protein